MTCGGEPRFLSRIGPTRGTIESCQQLFTCILRSTYRREIYNISPYWVYREHVPCEMTASRQLEPELDQVRLDVFLTALQHSPSLGLFARHVYQDRLELWRQRGLARLCSWLRRLFHLRRAAARHCRRDWWVNLQWE